MNPDPARIANGDDKTYRQRQVNDMTTHRRENCYGSFTGSERSMAEEFGAFSAS
jgi:hypothetical protein